jgi:hypothetical protein
MALSVIVLVFGMSVVGCDNVSDNNPINSSDENSITYMGRDLAGNEYTLIISRNSARSSRSQNDQGEDYDGNSGRRGDNYQIIIEKDDGEKIISDGIISDVIDDDTLVLQNPDDSEFVVTIRDGVISSIVGEITFADGTIFIVRTFDTIYLRANKWGDIEGNHGEQYTSSISIRLSDIYNGSLYDLISVPFDEWFNVRLSGNVDKELEFLKIEIHHIAYYEDQLLYKDESRWTYLGCGDGYYAPKFGPGEFSVEVKFRSHGVDLSTLRDGEIILQLVNELYNTGYWGQRDNGVRLPDDLPQYAIWATIQNLTIEPIN